MCFLQVLWDTMSLQVHVNTSIVVWGVTVWSTMRLDKESASAWITVNHIINPCVVQMGSCTRTIVSSTGPPASEDTRLPSCTVRSVSTKVRAPVIFPSWIYVCPALDPLCITWGPSVPSVPSVPDPSLTSSSDRYLKCVDTRIIEYTLSLCLWCRLLKGYWAWSVFSLGNL